MDGFTRHTSDEAARLFDAQRCRLDLRQLRAGPRDRRVQLTDGPLAGCFFPLDPYAPAGTSAGVVQRSSRGPIQVLYRRHPDGQWRFDRLEAVGW